MPLDRARIGVRYPPVTFTVDGERVRSFATAVGHPRDDVPPTFVTAPELASGLANVLGDETLGVALERVLHGEERYVWHRRLEVGETVSATSTVADIRGRPSLEFVTLRTEIRDATGALVCEATSTLIHRDA